MTDSDMPKLSIWIINQYASTPQTGIGGRSYYIGRALARLGHDVSVIAGSFSHLLREPPQCEHRVNVEPIDGFKMVWLKLPPYQRPSSVGRMLNWFRFAFALRRSPKVLGNRPDVIICSSPSLVSWLGAHRLARVTGAKLVFEVRDIWPLTLVELGGFGAGNPFVRFLQWIEDRAYARSDAVFATMPGAKRHMVGRGMAPEKFHWVPNGYDELGTPDGKANSSRDPGRFVVGYSGTVGFANALDVLLDCAERTLNDPQIRYEIVGDGALKEDMRAEAAARGLTNVQFREAVPKADVPDVIAGFDVCYIGARKNPLYRFGTSMNKVPEYLAAGKPLLFAIETSAEDPVSHASCVRVVPPEDADALAGAVRDLQQMPDVARERMGEDARALAEQHYNYRHIAAGVDAVLRKLMSAKPQN